MPSRPPADYRVTARTVGPGRARAEAGNEMIDFDASWASVDPSGLPGPAELLRSAFAACLIKNVERSAQLMPFRYEQAEVDVTAHRQDSPPKFTTIRYELRVTTDEPDERAQLLHRNLRKFGTVYNTLAATCDVDGSLRPVPPDG